MESAASSHKDPFDNLDDLFEKATGYAETRIDLFKLKATKQATEIASATASSTIFYVIIAIAVLILNIGIGLWLGELMGKSYYGFFVLAAVYLVAGFIFKAMRKSLVERPISNSIIRKIYNSGKDETK
ncbi:MAG: phage holin family protein [Ferruginibacter sp.]